MNPKKNVIEKFSDKKLERYIQPDSRYVSKAIQYAFEILQKRGRVFSIEEIDTINELINKKQLEETQEPESEIFDSPIREKTTDFDLQPDRRIFYLANSDKHKHPNFHHDAYFRCSHSFT